MPPSRPLTGFNPSDWYWIVAGSTQRVYSSKVGDYVPLSTPDFITWEGRNSPTRIESEASLGQVLSRYQLRPAPVTILDSYTDSLAEDMAVQAVAKVLFNHENRIRSLAGQSSVTPAQFKAFLKSQM